MNTMTARPAAENASLNGMLSDFEIGRDSEASWRNLKPTILSLISRLGAKRVLEIGGGRSPFLSLDDVSKYEFEYTVNDIDSKELARAPGSFDKICFDITRTLPLHVPRAHFDIVFSRMVFEHVKDGRVAWRNLCSLLAPGGVGFAYVPTLYSPPFLINYLLPDFVSGPVLRMINADRNDEKEPKFPAYYHLCRADKASVEPELLAAGFREVAVIPFFGTPYFPVVPGINRLARLFDSIVDKRNWTAFASYAYIVARK